MVGRGELVDKWVGWSSKKTLSQLEAVKGGVLQVDNLAALYLGDGDSFGMEVLETMRNYLQQHPGAVTIIFTEPEGQEVKTIEEMEQVIQRMQADVTRVGRQDLVGKYVGWSAKKTAEQLARSKVLQVEEAAGLYLGTNDTFGMEVLETMQEYLAKRPGTVRIVLGAREVTDSTQMGQVINEWHESQSVMVC